MKNSFWAAFAAALLGALVASSAVAADPNAPFPSKKRERRLEQRTPPGKVEPYNGSEAAAEDPQEQAYDEEDEDAGAEEISAEDQATIDRFQLAYSRAGSPRMAVYFNRELSDEVREWIPGDREFVEMSSNASGKASATSIENGKAESASMSTEISTETKGNTRSQRYVGATGGREDPREAYKWEMEDAVTNLFLDARSNVVDRAVIFRQMGKKPNKDGFDGSTSTTQNETAALNEYADILVEIRVTRSGKSALGYDFRATAKKVKSGQILASSFVKGSKNGTSKRNRDKHKVNDPADDNPEYEAVRGGYRKIEGDDLTVDRVSRELTLRLMKSMTPMLGTKKK